MNRFLCLLLLLTTVSVGAMSNDNLRTLQERLRFAVKYEETAEIKATLEAQAYKDNSEAINRPYNGETHLYHVISTSGDLEVIKILIAYGADINRENDRNRETPLHAAVNIGSTDIVALLLKMGADKNICDNRGFKPIHYANSNNGKSEQKYSQIRTMLHNN